MRPTVQGEFPLFGFEGTFVPLAVLCTDTAMLRIGGPRLNNGVALALERVRTTMERILPLEKRWALPTCPTG